MHYRDDIVRSQRLTRTGHLDTSRKEFKKGKYRGQKDLSEVLSPASPTIWGPLRPLELDEVTSLAEPFANFGARSTAVKGVIRLRRSSR